MSRCFHKSGAGQIPGSGSNPSYKPRPAALCPFDLFLCQFNMDPIITYSIFLGGLASLVPLLRFGAFVWRKGRPFFVLASRRLRYPLLIPRRYWMSMTWFECAILLLVLGGNLFALFYALPKTPAAFGRRSAVVAATNMVPLFLGGRTNLVADFLRVPLSTYYIFHHWIGRIAILQCILHSVIVLNRLGSIEKTPLARKVIMSGSLVSFHSLSDRIKITNNIRRPPRF